ncbi:hypothetical protein BC831DRAFT_479356 [Entophlyctis helioformis]|nr:hypothetical protein BC831DRAFT_479356 [Entophlyctis helioformis]
MRASRPPSTNPCLVTTVMAAFSLAIFGDLAVLQLQVTVYTAECASGRHADHSFGSIQLLVDRREIFCGDPHRRQACR